MLISILSNTAHSLIRLKTFCSIFGKNNFVNKPTWSLNDHILSSVDNLTYLLLYLQI